jgi:thiosulfate dehydrogenase
MKSGTRILVAFLLGVATIPLLLLLAAWRGLLPLSATAQPPKWEEKLADVALDATLYSSTKRLTVPVASNDQTLLAGLRIYRNNCAGCHGDYRAPSSWGSKNYYPRAPQFSERPPHRPVPEMFLAIKHGIRYSGMGAWDGMMPDENIWKVALFLGHLGSLPPEVDSKWRHPPKGAGG